MDRKQALEKIKGILNRIAPSAEVFLYGSEARGDASPDSDFDLLILEDSEEISDNRLQEITTPLYMLYYEEGIDVQPIVQTKREWESRRVMTPFYCNVKNEAIRL